MMNRANFGRPGDPALDKYYEENVIGGPGAFIVRATTLRFRPGGARQAGPRNLRRGGPAYARLNGAIFLSPRRSKQHHPAPMPGGSDRCWPTIR
jgi:hypothetical protein